MKKMTFLFPGQGSQYIGMGKSIFTRYPVAKQTYEEASDAVGFDIGEISFEGDMDELTNTENAQPAILTASVALFRVFMQEIQLEPNFMAGHSLGEISALTCSNAIKFQDAVNIVKMRGKFMQEAVPQGVGAMYAIGDIDRKIIEEECKKNSEDDKVVVVSNYNSPVQIVISGHKEAVEYTANKLKEMGAAVTPLNVSAPFHSPLMQQAADKLKEELTKYIFNELNYPVISNVTALPYNGKDSIIENLCMQVVQPVQWESSMKYLMDNGMELAVEMGPKTVLKSLLKKNISSIPVYSYDREKDIGELVEVLTAEQKPLKNDTGYIPTVVTKCIAIAVCTRNRNWDNEEYEKGVVKPYRKIQKMQEEIESGNRQPTIEEMREALEMLQSVFTTKKVPLEEKTERFNEVFDETGTRHLFSDFKISSFLK